MECNSHMNSVLRGALFMVGLLMGLFGLATLSLVSRYAPLWGTQEALYVLVYVVLTYLALGGGAVAFVPYVRVAEIVGGAGIAIAAFFGLGMVYYAIAGSGTIGIYHTIILALAAGIQAGCAITFIFVGRAFGLGGHDTTPETPVETS